VAEARFKVLLSQHLPGGTEENNGKSQSEQPASGPRSEPGTFQRE